MILLLDIGNTRIKWGYLNQGELQAGGALSCSGGDIALLFNEVRQCGGMPLRVVGSNVAGREYGALLQGEVAAHWGCEVEWLVTPSAAFGVVNGYDDPQTLGIDRWLALVAARQIVDGALCVIDCGTALTVDLLDRSGIHHGGMITTGLELMHTALVNNAEGLDMASAWQVGDGALFAARNTADGILGGVRYALVALVDRIAVDAGGLLGDEVSVVLTGGDVRALKPYFQHEYLFEPDLVLKGIAAVAEAGV